MALIEIEELKTNLPLPIAELITSMDDETTEIIILESEALMRSYLHQFFDTDSIFSATGTDRDFVMMRILKDIVKKRLYDIRDKYNEQVEQNYADSLLWLQKVSEGKLMPDLPARLVDSDGDGILDDEEDFLKLGGRTNYDNDF